MRSRIGNVVSMSIFQDSVLVVELKHLLGGLLLLLLGISLILIFGSRFFNWSGSFLSLGFLFDCHKQTDNVLGLDHVILINLEFAEDIVNFSFCHLVSPCFESVLEHLGVDQSVVVISLESLDDQVIGVVSFSSHLLCKHGDHGVTGAGTTDLSQQSVKLTL